ncbi:MAG: hypothetical protein CR982_10720 [Candidatus Cloacimonadota bacterium]|nr:MAG: hypothetical protein CR982_10720 [Candidatus Cloacimonadota bacterium]PIE78649.1 MAG: hypothetical protein CSA15_06760 [Candidatus Delongbacteria bacterium]
MFDIYNRNVFELKLKSINGYFRSYTALHGFIAGVLCTPIVVDPKILIGTILTKNDGSKYTFPDQNGFNQFLDHIISIYGSSEEDLYNGDYSIYSDSEESFEANLNNWVDGFVQSSIFWRDEDISKMDKDTFKALMSIILIQDIGKFEMAPFSSNKFYKTLLSIKKRSNIRTIDKLKEDLLINLYNVFSYSIALKLKHFKSEEKNKKRSAKPQSRNSLCSCGSGKKFKRCCGK